MDQSTKSRPAATPARAGAEPSACDFSSFKPKALGALDGLCAPAISRPKPAIPSEAKERGIAGEVKIKVLINTRGEVEQACVAEGDSVLAKAAIRAAFASKFGSYWGNRLIKEGYSRGEGMLTYRFKL